VSNQVTNSSITPPLILEPFRPYYPAWDFDELQQVLRDMDHASARPGTTQAQGMRRHERKPCSGVVAVRQDKDVFLRCGSRVSLAIVARNLSQSGLGALAPTFFIAEQTPHEVPPLRALDVFQEGALLELGLKRICGESLWLMARVVRARTVQHDFLDVGLEFTSRVSVPEVLGID